MRTVLLLPLVFLSARILAQDTDEKTVIGILESQTICWNRGDLECFMEGYWKSDSLMFIGKSGINYGWEATLENYRKGYPDREAMGKLTFDLKSVRTIGGETIFVVGQWHLQRSIGDLQGHFSLIWEKHEGKWVIVADHSS